MRRGHFVSLFASFFAVALCSVGAVAQTPATTRLVSVRADGAESCPDEAALRAEVAARLGWDAFAPGATTETYVTWWRDARGMLASRVVRRDDAGGSLGERTLESGADTCEELGSATAFAIAVAIDPAATSRAPASPPPAPAAASSSAATPVPVAPPTAPPSARAPASPPAPRAAPSDRVIVPFVGAGAHAAFLSAPAATAGGSVHVGVRTAFLSLTAEARFDAEGRGADEATAGEVGTTLALGLLVPCAHVDPVAFCAVAGLGALRAQGYEVDRPETDGTAQAAFGVRVGTELPLLRKRLGLFVQGDALFGVPRAVVELGGEPAFDPSPAHFSLGGGLRLHIGGLFDRRPPERKSREPAWR